MYLDLETPLKNLAIQVLQTLDPPVPLDSSIFKLEIILDTILGK